MIPDKIRELVELFERNIETYKSTSYNEARLRVEFINPFWKTLGWDMDNEAGHAPAYRDVIHEDAISAGGGTKAPDYCFRAGGRRKFFLEAKRPGVNIKDDATSAYQLRRYAWSGKLPVSILTDFEELAVYDGRIRPAATDKASKARIAYFTYKDYLEKWDEIAAVFSREAVLKGSFDEYAESFNGKRGTSEVDSEFLSEIENWRELLAKNIAVRNQSLNIRALNFSVQMTIDRIVFLRMCEDRGIEPYGQLQALCAGPRIYQRLLEIFEKADDKYNSGLFHFRQESDRYSTPDQITPKLKMDDKALKDILLRLYYPDSPYEFGMIPTEILGNVYEQFLGKVIRLTKGHQARVEEKPEVRKAGGVYYTPQFIVDYMVENTVGRFCEEKSPAEISRLRILDPACGSGSFLLGAYQFLIDYHLNWYIQKKEITGKAPLEPLDRSRKKRGKQPAIYEARMGEWRLTTREKKRILLNNIYGADIDPQAVEVTKLSLLLKVLENENQESLKTQLAIWRERALPDLSGNIKCGNSLIGPDFYCNGQLNLFDEEEQYRINVFDWNDPRLGFGDIIKSGGFDCVISNPPYIRIQAMKEWAPLEVDYYKTAYKSAGTGNYDIYVVFVEKGLSLLNKKGRLGFILPHKFFNSQYGKPLRGIIVGGKHLSEIVHFGDQQIFSGPTTYTCLMFLDKVGNDSLRFIKVEDIAEWQEHKLSKEAVIKANKIGAEEWNFIIGDGRKLFEKLKKMPVKLGDVCDIFVGLQTSADDVFIMDFVKETSKTITLKSKSLGENWSFEKNLIFPLVSGKDVDSYHPLPERQFILFPYLIELENAELINMENLAKLYPKTAEYLMFNKKILEGREKGKFRDYCWHRFGRNQNIGIQKRIKLCVPRLVRKLHAGFDSLGLHFIDNVDVGGVTLRTGYDQYDLRYILALLNSKILNWFFVRTSTTFRGGWRSANKQFIEKLPIRAIDFNKKKDVEMHDRMVSLVENMLDLHKKIQSAKTPDEKTRIERLISATDTQIDQLVYKLYNLSEADIKIIEND